MYRPRNYSSNFVWKNDNLYRHINYRSVLKQLFVMNICEFKFDMSLQETVKKDNDKIVRLCDTIVDSKFDNLPLHKAARFGDFDKIVRLRNIVIEKDEKKRTPIFYAAMFGHDKCISQLISMGDVVDAKDNGGNTPLHHAANGGHLMCMLKLSGTVVRMNNSGHTPLHLAARSGHSACAALLIIMDAQEVKDNKGWTPVQHAVRYNHCVTASLFCDVDTPDDSGWTPLHRASFYGHALSVQVLMSKGAKIRKDKEGKYPDYYAKNEECRKLFEDYESSKSKYP